MPMAFTMCTQNGGRVRRVSGPAKEHGLKAGEYVNYCYLRGKSYRGEVKQSEQARATKAVAKKLATMKGGRG